MKIFILNKLFSIIYLHETQTVPLAGLGRHPSLCFTTILILTTIEAPTVSVIAIKVPNPLLAVCAINLIELARDYKLLEGAANGFSELVCHIWRAQSQTKVIA